MTFEEWWDEWLAKYAFPGLTYKEANIARNAALDTWLHLKGWRAG